MRPLSGGGGSHGRSALLLLRSPLLLLPSIVRPATPPCPVCTCSAVSTRRSISTLALRLSEGGAFAATAATTVPSTVSDESDPPQTTSDLALALTPASVADAFPSLVGLSASLVRGLSVGGLLELERAWRSSAASSSTADHEAPPPQLQDWQLTALLRCYAALTSPTPASLDQQPLPLSFEEDVSATLICTRLVDELLEVDPSAASSSDPIHHLVDASFLHALLRRCVAVCDHPWPRSDEDGGEGGLCDVLCDAMLRIDARLQHEVPSLRTPSGTIVLTPAWSTNLLSLLVLQQSSSSSSSSRWHAVRSFLTTRRIEFARAPEPATDYVGYIRALASRAGLGVGASAWAPSERLNFARHLLAADETNDADYDAITPPPWAFAADAPVLLLLLEAASQAGETTVSLGLLALLEEVEAGRHDGSVQKALASHDGRELVSNLREEQVVLTTNAINEDKLAHALAHGYALALQAYCRDVDQHDEHHQPPASVHEAIEVWLRLRRTLQIKSSSSSSTSRRLRRRASSSHHDTTHLPALPPPASLRLPEASTLPFNLLRVLDAHGNVQAIFELAEALGQDAGQAFLQQLTSYVLREFDCSPAAVANATSNANEDSKHPAKHAALDQLRRLLDSHIHFATLSSPSPSFSSHDGSPCPPLSAVPLLVLALEVRAAAGDWAGLCSIWRTQFVPSGAVDLGLAHLAKESGRSFDAELHDATDQHDESIDLLPEAGPLLLRALDMLGLAALRTGDAHLLHGQFFDLPAMSTFPLALLARPATTAESYGLVFRHAALWTFYLDENWSAGCELIRGASMTAEPAEHNDSPSSPPILFNAPAWLEMGLECLSQLQEALELCGVGIGGFSGAQTTVDLENQIEAVWRSATIKRVLALTWADGSGGWPLDTVPSGGRPRDPRSALRVVLHCYTDATLAGSLGLMLRAVDRAARLHGRRAVEVQLTPWQAGGPEDDHQATEYLSAALLAEQQNPLSLPMAAVPPERLVNLPSLKLPFGLSSPWSSSSSGTPFAPVTVPFSSRAIMAPPGPGGVGASAAAAHSIQAYLLEEASAAWLQAPLPASLSEEDARARALRSMRALLLKHPPHVRTDLHQGRLTAEQAMMVAAGSGGARATAMRQLMREALVDQTAATTIKHATNRTAGSEQQHTKGELR